MLVVHKKVYSKKNLSFFLVDTQMIHLLESDVNHLIKFLNSDMLTLYKIVLSVDNKIKW